MAEKEYIEREAVMQKFADHVKRSNNSDFAPVPTWNQAVQIVEDFHAADVRPVVRGRWIWQDAPCFGNPYGSYKCECGCLMPHKTNFCPNCGADMMEEN